MRTLVLAACLVAMLLCVMGPSVEGSKTGRLAKGIKREQMLRSLLEAKRGRGGGKKKGSGETGGMGGGSKGETGGMGDGQTGETGGMGDGTMDGIGALDGLDQLIGALQEVIGGMMGPEEDMGHYDPMEEIRWLCWEDEEHGSGSGDMPPGAFYKKEEDQIKATICPLFNHFEAKIEELYKNQMLCQWPEDAENTATEHDVMNCISTLQMEMDNAVMMGGDEGWKIVYKVGEEMLNMFHGMKYREHEMMEVRGLLKKALRRGKF